MLAKFLGAAIGLGLVIAQNGSFGTGGYGAAPAADPNAYITTHTATTPALDRSGAVVPCRWTTERCLTMAPIADVPTPKAAPSHRRWK